MFNRLFLSVSFISTILGIVWISSMDRARAYPIIAEDGPFEITTVITLLTGGLLCLVFVFLQKKHRIFWSEFAILLLAMAIRETDSHRLVKGFNFLKDDFYVDPAIPVAVRLLYAVSLTGLAGMFLHFAWSGIRLLKEGWSVRAGWIFTGIMAIVAESLACIHHSFVRHLLRNVFHIEQQHSDMMIDAMEEPLEMLAAIYLCYAAMQLFVYFRKKEL